MGNIVNVNPVSIEAFTDKVKSSSEIIDEALKNLEDLTCEMDSFYDTPTGKNVKDTMMTFIKMIEDENNGILEYNETIKVSNEYYKETIKRVSKSIGKA